jgi:hypothetical protein
MGAAGAFAVSIVAAGSASAQTVSAAGDNSHDTADKVAYGIIIVAAIFGLIGLYRRCGRFSLVKPELTRLRAGGHKYNVHTFTGRLLDPTTRGETLVSGSSYVSGYVYEGTGSISGGGRVTSRTIVHDQFFIEDAEGRQRAFQMQNLNLAVSENHIVSVIWAIRPSKKTGPYIAVRNHTTNTLTYHDAGIKLLTRGRLIVHLFVCFCLLIAFFPLLVLAIVMPRYRANRFKASGAAALVSRLDALADQLRAAQRAAVAPPQFAAMPVAVPGGPAPAAPGPPVAPAPPTPPPPTQASGWFPDPTHRHQLRHWDGARWTEHTSDNGLTGVDPV